MASLVGTDPQSSNGATSIQFTVPGGAAAGHWMAIHVVAETFPTPDDLNWVVQTAVRDAENRVAYWFVKPYDGESTVTINFSGSSKIAGSLSVWSGIGGAGEVTLVENTGTAISSQAPKNAPAGSIILYGMGRTFLSDVDIDVALTEIDGLVSSSSGSAVSSTTAYEVSDGSPASRTFDVSAYSISQGESLGVVVLETSETNIKDALQGAWHWSGVNPRIYVDGDDIFYSTRKEFAGAYVRGFNKTTGVLDEVNIHNLGSINDHTHPALLVPGDDNPMVLYARHGSDALLRYRIGTTPKDLSTFAAEQSESFVSTIAYAHLYRQGTSDNLFAFTRRSNNEWAVMTSTDYGATWSSPQAVFDYAGGGNIYITARRIAGGDTLAVVMQTNPASTNGHVGFCFVDLATGDIDARDGTNLGNLDGTNLPLDIETDLDQILTGGGSNFLRVWDVADDNVNPAVIYSDSSSPTNGQYKVVRWSGSAWVSSTVASSGATMDGSSHFTLGACFRFGYSDEVILAREASGEYFVERWSTGDFSTWSEAEEIVSSARPLARPWTADADYVGWVRYQWYTNYDDYNGRIELYFYEPAGAGAGGGDSHNLLLLGV